MPHGRTPRIGGALAVGTTFINSPTAGYSGTVGNFAGEESNGKLTLDPVHRGVATVNPFTGQPEGILFQATYLNVNTPARSTPARASSRSRRRCPNPRPGAC